MKDIKVDLKSLPASIKRAVLKVRPYLSYVVIVIVLGAYAFILINIRLIAGREPTNEAVTEKLLEIKRPQVDKETVERLQQLKDQNVQVKALFDQARDNPFEE